MKTKFLQLLMNLFAISCFAQHPALEWEFVNTNNYDTSGSTYAASVIQTSDGGYASVAQIEPLLYDVRIAIFRFDSIGNLLWEKTFQATTRPTLLLETPDGGFIVSGSTSIWDNFWLAKINANGNTIWTTTITSPIVTTGCTLPYGLTLTNDGGCLISGNTCTSVIAVKVGPNGAVEWQAQYPPGIYSWGNVIKQRADGGFTVMGKTSNVVGQADIIMYKYDATGNFESSTIIGGNSEDQINDFKITPDGGYIIAGTTLSTAPFGIAHGFYDMFVCKLNSDFSIEWSKTYGGSNTDGVNRITQTLDGGYILAAYCYTPNGDFPLTSPINIDNSLLIKIDSTGNITWYSFMEYNKNIIDVNITNDGGYIVCGMQKSPKRIYVAKLSSTLSLTEAQASNISVFPNPSASLLKLFILDNTQIDYIKITDILGKEVLQQLGNQTDINVENLAPGMYIMNVFSGEQKLITKFIKL